MLYIFFFNDTATTEIYTLSLHDALPISSYPGRDRRPRRAAEAVLRLNPRLLPLKTHRRGAGIVTFSWPDAPSRIACAAFPDRKSTRLNSSHANISYAVFCLKKKKISTAI